MTEDEVKKTLENYKDGTATDAEKAVLESWYLSYDPGKAINEQLTMTDHLVAVDQVWAKLEGRPVGVKKLWYLSRVAVAASLLLILSFGTYFILRNRSNNNFEISATNDIAPGLSKARLTLADGKQIILDQAAKGEILTQAGIIISKTEKGELIYTAKTDQGTSPSQGSNTLETFKGEQHQLVLPDGSHIWLNASSSITFPVAFNAKERVVKITGEVYFEVAPDKKKPFIVKSKGQQVEVLGTHFNVNTYSDEPEIKTTLFEGAVRIRTASSLAITLKPGDQAILSKGVLTSGRPDLEEVIAWKNGYFMFEDEDIASIMRKVSRWYNVEVVYQGDLPQDKFTGTVDRYANISQILKKLQLTDKVHFKLEERRIIVTK
jgi:transmembrane sensor